MKEKKQAGIPKKLEYELIEKAKAGDREAMSRIVDAHTPFVAQVIKEFTLPPWMSMEDVLQEGKIGLIDAVHRFNLESGYRLCTFAYWRIKKAIGSHLSEMGYSVKIPYADVVKLKKIVNRIESGLSENPDEDRKTLCTTKSINIIGLILGCMPIHPTIHGSGPPDENPGEGAYANGSDKKLISKDYSDSVIQSILRDEIIGKIGELTVLEGVMLGSYLGLYSTASSVPLKHIAGEKTKFFLDPNGELSAAGGVRGFGLECGETYNNCSRIIRQGEARLRKIISDFLDGGHLEEYLEK